MYPKITPTLNQRSGTLDVIKFVGCIFIAMFHFGKNDGTARFPGGKFGVEMFCIISGAFFYKKYLRQKDTITVWRYIKARYLRFLPYTTVSFFLLFFLLPRKSRSISELADLFSNYIWELGLVSMSGINAGGALFNSPTWTIECLLIVECSILGLLICDEKKFFNIFFPLSLVCFYGIQANSDARRYRTWLGVANLGVLQVWCAVCCGILAAITAENIKNALHKPSKALTVAEFGAFVCAFVVMLHRNSFSYGLVVTLFGFIAVSVSLSQRSYSPLLFPDSKITRLLGEMSLAIYLNHSLILKLFYNHFGPGEMSTHVPLFLIVLILFALIYTYAMKVVMWGIRETTRIIKVHYMNNER